MMPLFRSRRRAGAALLTLPLILPLFAAEQRGELLNPWEIHNEITVSASAGAAVKENLLSFFEYQDLVMFHPTFGYYASGRVDFVQDYRTFPDALSPYFGQMIAEQVFRMWGGMRKAGTLRDGERFTIAEFGAGDGALAESILDYIDRQAESGGEWKEFAKQLVYACYDRSPALSAAQRKRNARFGGRFESREGDATDPTATIPAGSLKGVVLSNELPDAFSVQKVILSTTGSVEVGFVAPVVPESAWDRLKSGIPAAVQTRLQDDDLTIQTRIFGGKRDGSIYLGRSGFVALLEALSPSTDYARKLDSIDFHEIYVPIETMPELAGHVRKYSPAYAYELAKAKKSFAAYINLGEGKFIQGAGRILKSGYVITIDYGSNWDSVSPLEFDHFRAYGPGSTTEHSNPYHSPTLNDMTTDVNFGHMVEEGKLAGLHAVFFGSQHTLITGTPINIETPSPGHGSDDYDSWVQNFYTWDVYKVLVEQKENTDPSYSFPDNRSEPIGVNPADLSEAQQTLEREIEQRLRDRLADPPVRR
jgi:SAM-dependent MidA family methyltransferase